MSKLILIMGSLASIIGLGYFFIKPTFKVGSIDGVNQKITYSFDGQTYTYDSGIGKADVIKSRGYSLTIRDNVVGFGSIAISGSIKVEISQFGKSIQNFDIKPSDHGIYLWKWRK
jgi:hypothetical protein